MIDWNPASARIISCDVFDTLLKRNTLCEHSRVTLIARHAATMLARECSIVIAPAVLGQARNDVQRYAYRGLDMLHPDGEVKFARMMDGMATALGLGPDAARVLARAEIAVEKTQLAPNRRLLAWLKQRAGEGVPIIAISDTWHEALTITDLLNSVAPGHPVARVYTSADLDATKRSARIFALVAAREAVRPESFLHIGDDAVADVSMALRAGLQVSQVMPARSTILRRKLDGALHRAFRRLPPA
jgi:predicted HAD superfamily hydrolase